jgi:4-hydroxyphenylpyruvate dioxygenase
MTAPYSQQMSAMNAAATDASGDSFVAPNPLPSFSVGEAHAFFQKHGLAARAIGLEVEDAKTAFEASVANGAKPVLEPTFLPTCNGQKDKGVILEGCHMAEVELYGNVVLRYVSYPDENQVERHGSSPLFLPHLNPVQGKIAEREIFGIQRIDHAVGNVHNLLEAYERVKGFTGFHEFAEFTAEDVGTVDSGLNSVVLASDSENVLLPLNEPTTGRYVLA